MKSSRMRAKTDNAKTATKLLVAMTRALMRKAKHCEPNGWCRPWQVGRADSVIDG